MKSVTTNEPITKEAASVQKPKKTVVKAAASKVEATAKTTSPEKPEKKVSKAVQAESSKPVVKKTAPAASAEKVPLEAKPPTKTQAKASTKTPTKTPTKTSTKTPIKASTKKSTKTSTKTQVEAEPMKLLANNKAEPSREEILQMIATAAYYRAEKRSFEVGYEHEDWLMAEREVNQLLSIGS